MSKKTLILFQRIQNMTKTKEKKKVYKNKQRSKLDGFTMVNIFPLRNDLHDFVTDTQKEIRNKSGKKPPLGECINRLLEELQEIKSK